MRLKRTNAPAREYLCRPVRDALGDARNAFSRCSDVYYPRAAVPIGNFLIGGQNIAALVLTSGDPSRNQRSRCFQRRCISTHFVWQPEQQSGPRIVRVAPRTRPAWGKLRIDGLVVAKG
jgi:hypothetical protein